MGKWKIWADTGGTFTDCIAISPENEIKRIKILSSSALRGTIQKKITDNTFEVKVNWNTKQSIFAGYQLYFASNPDIGLEIEEAFPTKGIIKFSQTPSFTVEIGSNFSITAQEEAPIMAARLATDTPLQTALPPLQMRIGSTKGTNALLERKGAATALLVTKGFKDLMLIGDQTRPNIFSLEIEKTPPLHHLVIEVDERLNATGQVLNPLSQDEIAPVINELKSKQIKTVAVSFMHSYLNHEHEQKLKQYLHAFGIDYISISTELEPSIDYLARTSTALINAYLSPVIDTYIKNIASKIDGNELKIITSAGGLNGSDFFKPKDSLLSGPAGGVVGAAAVAEKCGKDKIITFDMGGTSTDVARYAGEFDYQFETEIASAKLMAPSLAIHTVAAGGGSICQYDNYKFTVGPESAGAFPGPACYGNGGPLTITDINLLLGKIDPNSFGIPLNVAAAKQAFEKLVGENITEEKEKILTGFIQIANEKMADAIRKISVSKGYDPTEYALLAFGGAGGQHACSIATLLNMEEIIIPYNAGLLSAYGMGQANVERFATKQILKPYEEVQLSIKDITQKLADQAINQLEAEGYQVDEVEVRKTFLYLRYLGQNYNLEIAFREGENPLEVFYKKYQDLYGYLPKEGIPEITSIKVIASTVQKNQEKKPESIIPYKAKSGQKVNCFLTDKWQKISVFSWEELSKGAAISGPALLVSQNSTVVIEENWELHLDHDNNAILKQSKNKKESQNLYTESEAVQLELFTNRFKAVTEEMGALLQKTALSVNIKERLDFSCALLDKNGLLVVNAPHIPVHLGSMGICVRKTKAKIKISPGDVIITNHPNYGGSHLPDITLIAGVFDNENKLIGYVANRAHHAEIGGIAPGSFPANAKNLAEEGVVISPTYLVKNHEVQWENIIDLLKNSPYPTRAIKENIADLNASLASIMAGKKAITALIEQFGGETIVKYMEQLNHYTAALMLEKIQQLDQKQYSAIEKLDDGTEIVVKIIKTADKLMFDFKGTTEKHVGNLNATEAITTSVVIYVLRLLINRALPLNEGLMKHIELKLPNCFLNPLFEEDPSKCPAVAGGNTETSQRLTDTLLKAFGLAACSQGTMNNLLFGNNKFGYYETIGGGSGAGNGFSGTSAVHQHMTNTRITDPEIMENRYPVRLNKFSIRKDSGGEGKYSGGNGIERQISFLTPVELTLLTQHRAVNPYGLHGGKDGLKGKQKLTHANGKEVDLPGIITLQVGTGDKITILTPGGGGYGQNEE